MCFINFIDHLSTVLACEHLAKVQSAATGSRIRFVQGIKGGIGEVESALFVCFALVGCDSS